MMRGIGRFALRFTPTGWVARAQKKLVWAAWAERMDGNTWAAIRLISAIAGVVAAFLLVPLVSGTLMRVAVGGLVLFLGAFGPEVSLNRAIDDRRKQMEKQLPDIIDLLVISVEAGLGFEAAMARVVQTVPGLCRVSSNARLPRLELVFHGMRRCATCRSGPMWTISTRSSLH